MPKNFVTEIREVSGNQYVKVFPANIKLTAILKSLVEKLDSVKTVNITESKSASNQSLTLTVYSKKTHSAKECEEEINILLTSYFSKVDHQKISIGDLIEINDILNLTKKGLEKHPKINKLIESAQHKYLSNKFERNVLDDLRLALELLLKEILNNNKSLENQMSEIGKYQSEKGLSKEFVNMFNKLIDYYTKYQNNYVKHDDNVNNKELDAMINLTLLFIRGLVN